MKIDANGCYSVFTAVDKGHPWFAWSHKLFHDKEKAIRYAQKRNGFIVYHKTLSNKKIIGEVINYEKI